MTQPWMKFSPKDWRSDPRLRMCSLAARGLWIDLISYMHEGDPYGHLIVAGQPPGLDDIASLIGRPLKETTKAFDELMDRGVFSETEEGIIYSRRMVRDKAKADQDAANGRGGGNPKLLKKENGGVNPQANPGDKAKKLEARDQSSEPKGSGACAPPGDPKADLFHRAREVLGPKSGGSLTAKLLKTCGNEDDPRAIAKARARIEDASTKANPAEWLGRVINGPAKPTTESGEQFPDGII